MSYQLRLSCLLFTSLNAGIACAGTLITTNLPSGTMIVNCSGTNEGASGYDGGQNNWYNPFAYNGVYPPVPVEGATYSFELINAADAHIEFPTLTSDQLAQIYTAWSYNSPWVEDYFVFDISAVGTSNIPELFSGAAAGRIPNYASTPGWNGGGWNTADQAYSAARSGGVYNKIYIGGRNTGTEQSSYTFPHSTSIVFVVPDYDDYDNHGGVSVVISKVGASHKLSGTIHFSDFDFVNGIPPKQAIIDIEDTSNNLVRSDQVPLDAAGNFSYSASVPAGTYLISTEIRPWLRRTIGPYNLGIDVTGLIFNLINGDATGDNGVDTADYAAFAAAYGSFTGDANFNKYADFNGDGGVDTVDYAIFAQNYGAFGDN